MTNFSSNEFIQKIKDKDPESLTVLINEYHEALFKAALKQGLGLDQAEEVVQGTWAVFFEKASNFEGRSHIRTYIFGIMYNKIKELWRSNKKYTSDYDDSSLEKLFNSDGSYGQAPITPSSWSESKEMMNILYQEVQKLPPNQKIAFTLKEVEGETTEEICKILDVSVTNLGVLIYRAKNHLRLGIEKRLAEDNDD